MRGAGAEMRAERWRVSEGWTGTIEAMTNSASSRYPITVTRLPLVRCAVCRRTIAHRPGDASVVLTKHYEKTHPEMVSSE